VERHDVTDAPHAGEARVVIEGKEYTLLFDWRAFSMLGKAGFTGMESLTPYEPERLAEILAIGLARHHPEMTATRLLDISPPFLPVINALARAIGYALTGPGEDKPANPPPAAASPPRET
jgi:hypothetical protein